MAKKIQSKVKAKTHKGIAKRFKLTASGKAKFRTPFRGHLLSHKTGDRKRQLRSDTVISGPFAKVVEEALRPSK